MTNEPRCTVNLVFIFPFGHTPIESYDSRFRLHSEWSKGFIFTQSNTAISNHPIHHYKLYARKKAEKGIINNFFSVIKMVVLMVKTLKNEPAIDAVIVYDPLFSGLCGCFLKYWFKTKLVLEINGGRELLTSDANIALGLFKKCAFSLTSNYADTIKVINQDEKDYFSKLYTKKPIYKFMDFVNSDRFVILNSSQGNYLLSIGYPFKLKGMDLIIRAFNKISNLHPNIQLKIMGYCPEDEIEFFKEMCGDNKNIVFIKAGDVREPLKDCYAYISASRSEAGGVAMVEAMCCKKPIVATATKGGRELVHDKQNGLLCKIDNIDDLADKINQILNNRTLARQLGENGYELVLNKLNENQFDANYHKLINEICHIS